MRQDKEGKLTASRRTFLSGLLASVGGLTALLAAPKKAHARKKPTVPATGPVLYRRTPEAERYYRTLYL